MGFRDIYLPFWQKLYSTNDDKGVAGRRYEWKNHGRPWPCEREGPKAPGFGRDEAKRKFFRRTSWTRSPINKSVLHLSQ